MGLSSEISNDDTCPNLEYRSGCLECRNPAADLHHLNRISHITALSTKHFRIPILQSGNYTHLQILQRYQLGEQRLGKWTQPMSSSNLIAFTDLELHWTDVRSGDSFESLIRNCHSKHNYWWQPCSFLHYFLVYCPCNGWQPWLSASIQSHKSSHSRQELPVQATVLNHKGSKIGGLCIQAFHQSSGELFSLYK